jgi:hypothetical protein
MSKGETMQMTHARPGEGQFEATVHFLNVVEWIVEQGILHDENETELDLDDSGDRLKAFAFIQDEWEKVSHCWQRVLFAGYVAIDNACDPNNKTLVFKPEILQAIEDHPRLTTALHAAKAHPDYSYIVIPSDSRMDMQGWEHCHEASNPVDACWRRRKQS